MTRKEKQVKLFKETSRNPAYKYGSILIKKYLDLGFTHLGGKGSECGACGRDKSVRTFFKNHARLQICYKCAAGEKV